MTRLARYSWIVLVYNLGVVAWGAYVRATGSGAGCGSHWPLCNGDVVPRAAATATLIEYSHRLTSGIALVSVVVLFIWARRETPSGHPARVGATASLCFMLSEAILGAGLVLFELVAGNASAARAVAVAAHLLNTFLLLASLALAAWWASGGPAITLTSRRSQLTRLSLGAAAILLVSCTGAITALGDTLFPSASLQEALSADFSSSSHGLIRLRTIHPILAVITALVLMTSVWRVARDGGPVGGAAARWLTWLFGIQLAAGFANVMLLAPVWLQLVHLLLADLIWVAFVLLGADALAARAAAHPASFAPAAVTR